jgi:hypothetical protein
MPAPAPPRSLLALSVFYGGMVCIAGVLGNKQVALGPLSQLGVVIGVGPRSPSCTGARRRPAWCGWDSCR